MRLPWFGTRLIKTQKAARRKQSGCFCFTDMEDLLYRQAHLPELRLDLVVNGKILRLRLHRFEVVDRAEVAALRMERAVVAQSKIASALSLPC